MVLSALLLIQQVDQSFTNSKTREHVLMSDSECSCDMKPAACKDGTKAFEENSSDGDSEHSCDDDVKPAAPVDGNKVIEVHSSEKAFFE